VIQFRDNLSSSLKSLTSEEIRLGDIALVEGPKKGKYGDADKAHVVLHLLKGWTRLWTVELTCGIWADCFASILRKQILQETERNPDNNDIVVQASLRASQNFSLTHSPGSSYSPMDDSMYEMMGKGEMEKLEQRIDEANKALSNGSWSDFIRELELSGVLLQEHKLLGMKENHPWYLTGQMVHHMREIGGTTLGDEDAIESPTISATSVIFPACLSLPACGPPRMGCIKIGPGPQMTFTSVETGGLVPRKRYALINIHHPSLSVVCDKKAYQLRATMPAAENYNEVEYSFTYFGNSIVPLDQIPATVNQMLGNQQGEEKKRIQEQRKAYWEQLVKGCGDPKGAYTAPFDQPLPGSGDPITPAELFEKPELWSKEQWSGVPDLHDAMVEAAEAIGGFIIDDEVLNEMTHEEIEEMYRQLESAGSLGLHGGSKTNNFFFDKYGWACTLDDATHAKHLWAAKDRHLNEEKLERAEVLRTTHNLGSAAPVYTEQVKYLQL